MAAEQPPVAAGVPPFEVGAEAIAVLETLWHNGHAAYLVGGGVRDALLGLPVSDWDVATDARPERIQAVFPGATYQNRFGTVQARGQEITTFRREHRYADHRRPDSVTFSDDVYEDLARRDLTINAIAWGRRGPDAAPQLIDPADGQGDLRARLVRAVGDPSRRFAEDALRLLRAVRIASRLGFTIEPATKAAMTAHASDIQWVSEERIGSELRRMLDTAEPSRAFRLLRETGILAAAMPELQALPDEQAMPLAGAAGQGGYRRALDALDAAVAGEPGNERVALAALLAEAGVEAARGLLQRLCISTRDGEAVCTLIELAMADYAPGWSDADVRRYMGQSPSGLIDDLLALRLARAQATGGEAAVVREDQLAQRVQAERQAGAPLSLAELAVDGRDLRETMGLPEGPIIGSILERLLADVIEEPSLNQRITLLTRASLILDTLVQSGIDGAEDPRIG